MSSAGLPKAWRGLNAGSYTPPPLLVCLQPRLLKPSSAYARFYQAGPLRQPRRPPSALSPFAQLGCYLRWGDVVRLLGGRYPSFVAHTGSCATPVELSLPSAFSLVPRVLAGCTQSLLLTGACRVGEDVAILTPHRTGCAEFQLPVPHGRASLTAVYRWTIRAAGRGNRLRRSIYRSHGNRLPRRDSHFCQIL